MEYTESEYLSAYESLTGQKLNKPQRIMFYIKGYFFRAKIAVIDFLYYRPRRWYRNKKAGVIIEDTYDIQQSFLEWIIPRLRYLNEHKHSYPDSCKLKSDRGETKAIVRWTKIIDDMIVGFEFDLKYLQEIKNPPKRVKNKINKAYELFVKHREDLWD